jgi:hypothetical protein
MTDLDAKIAALEAAAASGALRIESNGEMIIYRNMTDLLKALVYFTAQRADATNNPAPGVTLATFGCD